MSTLTLNPQVPGEEPKEEQEPEIQAEAPARGRPKAPAGLPDQKSINPDKITRAVLSKDGWVVPKLKPKA